MHPSIGIDLLAIQSNMHPREKCSTSYSILILFRKRVFQLTYTVADELHGRRTYSVPLTKRMSLPLVDLEFARGASFQQFLVVRSALGDEGVNFGTADDSRREIRMGVRENRGSAEIVGLFGAIFARA